MEHSFPNQAIPVDMDALRTLIKARLSFCGLTVQNLADHTQIPKDTLDNFLSGSTTPSFDRVFLVCSALGISLDELAGLRSPESPSDSGYSAEYVREIDALHQRTLAEMPDAHKSENAVREDHLHSQHQELRVWRAVALAVLFLFTLFFSWFLWDVSNGGRGLIRYSSLLFNAFQRG